MTDFWLSLNVLNIWSLKDINNKYIQHIHPAYKLHKIQTSMTWYCVIRWFKLLTTHFMCRDICYVTLLWILSFRLKVSIFVNFVTKSSRSLKSSSPEYKKTISVYLFVKSWKLNVHWTRFLSVSTMDIKMHINSIRKIVRGNSMNTFKH